MVGWNLFFNLFYNFNDLIYEHYMIFYLGFSMFTYLYPLEKIHHTTFICKILTIQCAYFSRKIDDYKLFKLSNWVINIAFTCE